MTDYILGVDIGTASCSAVAVSIDDNGNPIGILHEKTQIFSPPYQTEKSGFVSKAAIRRKVRQQRRQIDRRKYRIKALVKWFENNNITTSQAISKTRCTPTLRTKAAKEKISLAELGSVLLNIAKRRGYKGKLSRAEGDVAKGNAELVEKMNLEQGEGCTLGAFLSHLSEQGLSTKLKHHGMYALREQYQAEVIKILSVQSEYHSQLVQIKDELIEFMFYQQALKSSESLIGQCDIEPRHKRALKASPENQAYRILALVNNLRWAGKNQNKERLTPEQKTAIFALLNDPLVLDQNGKITYLRIREFLYNKSLASEVTNVRFTHERSKHSAAVGNKTISAFNKLGLLTEWNALNNVNKNRLLNLLSEDSFKQISDNSDDVEIYLSDVKPYSSLKRRNEEEWRTLLRFLNQLLNIKSHLNLQDCYLDIGRAAFCTKVLTELTEYFLNFPNEPERNAQAFSKYQRFETKNDKASLEIKSDWQSLKDNLQCDLLDYVDGLIAFDEKKWTSLKDFPFPPKTGNPVVDRAMRQTGRVIKYFFSRYGAPRSIRIETVRELSFGPEKRNSWEKKRENNEKLNNSIRLALAEKSEQATARNIKRYKLWEEQGFACPYCSKPISFEMVLDGSKTNFEHIQPKSESGIGLRMHEIVLAHRECNDMKADDWPVSSFRGDEQRYLALQNMAKHYKAKKNWYFDHKAELLTFESNEGYHKPLVKDDSIAWAAAQMQSTGWIARNLNYWLKSSKIPLFFTKGGFTAKLRNAWQLDDIIPQVRFAENRTVWQIKTDSKGQNVEVKVTPNAFEKHLEARQLRGTSHRFKSYSRDDEILRINKRVDHRHHAIDALVIALTSPYLLQVYRRAVLSRKPFRVDLPYPNLKAEAENMIRNCNLHHTPDKNPPKQFFKEAPRAVVDEYLAERKNVEIFAKSKNIDELEKQLKKIVSEDTREIFHQQIEKRCKEYQIPFDEEKKLPYEATKEQIQLLFIDKGINEKLSFGIKDFRFGSEKSIKKVLCYSYTGATKAKAESGWRTQSQQGDITHQHIWQVEGNACLMLNLSNFNESRVLSNIEYYTTEIPKDTRLIFAGDTVVIDGRRMKVRQLSAAANRLALSDIVEASSMKTLEKEKGNNTAILAIGKKRFKELLS